MINSPGMTRAILLSFTLASAALAAHASARPIPARAANALSAAPPPGRSPRIDAIRRRGILRVAVLDEYPWLKQNRPGASQPFAGPAWRLAQEYARRLGVRIVTTPVDFSSKVSAVIDDKVDITIAPLLVTPDRKQQVDIIRYSVSAQCLLGLASNPKIAAARAIDDLDRADVTIAYMNGAPQGAWLQSRLPKAKRLPVTGSLADVPLDALERRQADVTNIDKFFVAGLQRKHPDLVSVPKGKACLASRELPIPIGMAIAKGQPVFLAWLRAVARSIQPDTARAETVVRRAPF